MQAKSLIIPFDQASKWSKQRSVDLKCPRFLINETGKKIVVVCNIGYAAFKTDSILSEEQNMVFKNITEYLKTVDTTIKEFTVVNFNTFKPYNMSESAQNKLNKQWLSRIENFATKYGAESIVILDKPIFRLMSDLPPEKEFNVVNKYKEFKIVLTATLDKFAAKTYKEAVANSNTIGLVIEAMQQSVKDKVVNINKSVNNCKKILIDSIKKFDKFMDKLNSAAIVAIDTEIKCNGILRKKKTGGEVLNRIANKLLTIQFCLDGHIAYTVPFYHPQTPFNIKQLEYMRKRLVDYFETGKSNYHVYHNAKFDLIQIRAQLKPRFIRHNIYDTMAGEYLLDENRKFVSGRTPEGFNVYSLEALEHKYGYRRHGMAVTKDQRTNLADVDLKDVADYGVVDAITTYYVHVAQRSVAKERGKHYAGFLNTIIRAYGPMLYSFSTLEINGAYVDKKHLLNLTSKTSEVYQIIDALNLKFKDSVNAQEANKIIAKKLGVPMYKKDLFGKTEIPWYFNIRKPEHKKILFFDVMKLEPINIGKNGPSVDKKFQSTYKNILEVEMLSNYNKATKLRDTYITGLWKILSKDNDAKLDGFLRSDYGFIGVVTGRSSVSDPGFQQIPSRDKLAKLIKRMFIAPVGYLTIEADYSAHEVRDWGNTSEDENICNTFRKGLTARRKLRINKSKSKIKKLKTLLEQLGDVHKLNFQFFFGRPPKDKSERNKVKEVVFGVIYGKTAKALAASLGITEEEAQDLINKLFKVFKRGGSWIKNMQELARLELKVVSKLGTIRHLSGYLHYNKSIHNAMDRRSVNSPIQGAASLIGYIASYCQQKLTWELFISKGQPFTARQGMSVHDSNKGIAHLVEIPIAAYIQEHAMTTEVHRWLSKNFNIRTLVDYEVEFEMGGSQADVEKWDFMLNTTEEHNKHLDKPGDAGIGIIPIIDHSIDWQITNLGYRIDKETVMKAVIHNAKIINKLRQKELKASLKLKEASTIRYLTKENSLKLGLIFADQFTKEHPKAIRGPKNV